MELIQIKPGATTCRPEKKLDVKTVQQKLSAAQGPEYWRSLEELAGTAEFEELLHREFPRQASEWIGGERIAPQLPAANERIAGAGGLSGCTKMPTQTIVPYVRTAGRRWCWGVRCFTRQRSRSAADAMPVLARSNEGRPTKIEGNPEHPASKGRTTFVGAGVDPRSLRSRPIADQFLSRVSRYRGAAFLCRACRRHWFRKRRMAGAGTAVAHADV